jgi:hypothetical protein
VGLVDPFVVVLFGPIAREHENGMLMDARDDGGQQPEGLHVVPVQVLEHHDHRLDPALRDHQVGDRARGKAAALHRLETAERMILREGAEQIEHRRNPILLRLIQQDDFRRHLLPDRARLVAFGQLEIALQEIDERQVWRGTAVGNRLRLEHQPAARVRRMDELAQETRLAHAGRADHRQDLALGRGGTPQGFVQRLHLEAPPDERREPARCRRLQARADRGRRDELVDLDRRRQPLERNRAQRLGLQVTLGQTQAVAGDQDRARCRKLLQPRCEMRGLADCGVVHAQIVPDRADHDFARVESGADLDRNALGLADLVRELRDRLLHPQRRVARPDGVVFVRKWSAEDGHDAVAHHLVHRALVPVNRIHHLFEHRIEQLAGVLRVPVREQLHGALHVREQNRHLLALAFEGAARCQDLFGQVAGRVALRGAELRRPGRASQRRAAFAAESLGRGIMRAACRTDRRQPRPACATESASRGVLLFARRALHGARWGGHGLIGRRM